MQVTSVSELRIASFSAICADFFSEPGIFRPGGNSLNFAIHAKRLGAGNVSIGGFIGNDSKGDLIISQLKTDKIDISFLIQLEGNTPSNIIYNTAEGERYAKPGEWVNGVKDTGVFTEEAWNFFLKHDIIAVPYLDKNLNELFKRHSQKNFIIMDFLHYDDPEIISELLPFLDAAFISPQLENVAAIRELARNSKTLLVTMLGKMGSKAFLNGNEFTQEAFNVKKVTDTTGCGDSYQAGFICSYFIQGDIKRAMLAGTTTASQVLTHYGGV
jgi:fructoselysine 6-kinase